MQLELVLVLQLLFAHWVSDFVLQSGWMATNKSRNWLALTAHVGTYTASMGVIMLLLSIVMATVAVDYDMFGAVLLAITPTAFAIWILINGALHFITDAVTSRITTKLWLKGDMHNFFVVVGFDQLVHYVCLFTTLIALWNY